MKVILVGAGGDIGRAALSGLTGKHEIVTVGRTSGDYQVDVTDLDAVRALYAQIGRFDALVSCAGDTTFANLQDFTQDSFMKGLTHKVMGQVNLVLAGLDAIADGGSFTLTSGILDRDPILMGANAATANGALAGFVKGAALEMPRGARINVVSPGLIDVSEDKYGAWFPGHKPVATSDVARAYVKAVEGPMTGQVITVD